MEKEVSFVVEISVALLVLSAVIGIIWFTVFLGNTMANDVAVEGSELLSSTELGVMNDMCDTDTILPTSGVYSLLRTYSSYIPVYRCNLHANPTELDLTVTQAPCVLQHMTGKVSLEALKTDEGWYEVTVHHMHCNWFLDVCNCKTLR